MPETFLFGRNCSSDVYLSQLKEAKLELHFHQGLCHVTYVLGVNINCLMNIINNRHTVVLTISFSNKVKTFQKIMRTILFLFLFTQCSSWYILQPFSRNFIRKTLFLVSFNRNKNYMGELKVLQFFNYVKHNSAVLDALAEIMKVTNHTGLWMLSSPDSPQVLLTRFASIACSTAPNPQF